MSNTRLPDPGGWSRSGPAALVLLASLLMAGCVARSGPRHSLVEPAVVAEEVRAALRAFEQAQRERSVEQVLAVLDPSLRMLRDGVRIDYAVCAEEVRQSLPALQSVDARFDEIEIQVLSADLALSSMIFHDEVVDADGVKSNSWGSTTLLWRKRAGQWRVVFADADHRPAEEAPEAPEPAIDQES